MKMKLSQVLTLALAMKSIRADDDADKNFDFGYFSDKIRSEILFDDSCREKGSFDFPGAISYEKAKGMCKSRGGTFYLYSFSLLCEQSEFHSILLDAICLQDCSGDEASDKIQKSVESTYPSCSVKNVEYTLDSSILHCLDITKQIESGIKLLKQQFNMTYSVEGELIKFSNDDISSFSDECVHSGGKVVTSSFEETTMKDSNVPGQCHFTEIMSSTAAKVENLPRCFSSACSPQTIRRLLSVPENRSKWYCKRDVYSVNFNSTGDLEYIDYPNDKKYKDSTGNNDEPTEDEQGEDSNSAACISKLTSITSLFIIAFMGAAYFVL